jgi:FkbM family methyltransferase
LNQLLSQEKTFIDVGANQGEFTLFAAKRLRKGRVIAFEPTSSMYERLTKNVTLNGFRNVDLVKKALSDKPGQLPIYTSKGKFHDDTVNAGLPSLYRTGTNSDYLETIDVTTLDVYVRLARPERIDVIKIDIEGAELSMLQGAAETIASFRPILIIEVSRETCCAAGYDSGEILKYVESQGYRIERILPGGGTQPVGSATLADYQNVVCYPI